MMQTKEAARKVRAQQKHVEASSDVDMGDRDPCKRLPSAGKCVADFE